MVYLTRRDPRISVPAFQASMNRLFEEAFDELLGPRDGGTTSWAPPVDIYETENELVAQIELPDFDRDDVHISFEGGRLTIAGERKPEERAEGAYHRRERWIGKFERSFQLPASVDPNSIKAHLEKGLLQISIPKREEAKPRQITVSVD